jgi:maltokinase
MSVQQITESAFAGERWYAGKARRLRAVRSAGAIQVPGRGGGGVTGPGAAVVVADVDYEDGGAERYLLLDGEPDWPALLRALPLRGPSGRLELRPGPALSSLLPANGADLQVPSTDQTNTLVVTGDLLIKLYRRLEPGNHPEVELLAALAATDAPVPAYVGSIWHVDPHSGAETAVALLQEFVAGATSGWEAPIERAAAWLREPGATDAVEAEHSALGRAAGALRDALIAALGSEGSRTGTRERWYDEALSVLKDAAVLDDAASDPEIPKRLALLRGPELPVGQLSRIHGDLHIAQFLRTDAALYVVDFEGDPTRALDARRSFDTPLRDLASLLRSIDHVGEAAARRVPGTTEAIKQRWISAAAAAVLDGWGGAVDLELLHGLEVAKECQELVYAARVVPEWSYAPRAGLRRLLDRRPGAPA